MEINNSKSKIYWVYLIGFFFIASLPFWAAPPLLHPAPWGKTIVFRIILSILIFFFVYQIAYCKNISLLKRLESKAVKSILGLLALLFSLFLLSTIFSQDISFSFWGSPWRAGGFLIFAFYIIFALLAFSIIKDRDWKKIWDFSIFVGILVVVFGICQYFKMFPDFIVSLEVGVASTMGSSGLFAPYLSFLFFLALSLGLKEKSIPRKIFYFLSILLFIFGIFISGARAVYLAIIIGLFFFFFFYPKKMARLKIITSCLLILAVLVIYYLNVFPEPPGFVKNNTTSNKIFSYVAARSSLKQAFIDLTETRFSAWRVGLQAIKEKPILGWGPENFSIGYDKYYDPTLPQIATLWWDRAHNFLIEYATTGGIPFLIVYLLLIGVLFWQLQKLKNPRKPEETSLNQRSITIHGIQATFIAYLAAMFFSFDGFDTYLLFFLLTGYCLHLISSSQEVPSLNQGDNTNNVSLLSFLLHKWRKIIIFLLFIFLLLFIWFGNLKPLFVNKELNWAEHYSTNGNCQKAINKMEKVLPSHSIIDEYVMLEYSDVLKECQIAKPEQQNEFVQKSIQVLEKAAKLRPTYIRTWLLLGNYLILSAINNPDIKTDEKEALLLKADSCFKKAAELSPKRQEIFLGWSYTYLVWGKYDEAKEKSEQCININDKFGGCYWQKALSNLALVEFTEYEENIKKAKQNGFETESQNPLSQLLNVYIILSKNPENINREYYRTLADIYYKLIYIYEPNNSQYRASLAYVYKELGQYKNAGKEAVEVFKLQPENKVEIEKFLKSLLSLDVNSPSLHTSLAYIYTQTGETEKAKEELLTTEYLYLQLIAKNPKEANYHFNLARVYRDLGEYEKARKEAQKVIELSPESKASVEEFLKTLY
ncbi:O-antigen ligase family protein [Patescibacteria group bacterium]|nr:O-antigen ligase family protein [Patescibacteria group bacterium]